MGSVHGVNSSVGEGRWEKGYRTPQVGIAEAAGSQAVCAVTEETKRREMVARIPEAFMVTNEVVMIC